MSLPSDYWNLSFLQRNKEKNKEKESNKIENTNNNIEFSSLSSLTNKSKNNLQETTSNNDSQKIDNSLNLSYLLKQSSLIPENKNDNSEKKINNNSNINDNEISSSNKSKIQIKREMENSHSNNNTSNSKKIKTEDTNNDKLLNQQNNQNTTMNMIPQLSQYDYSLNPTYYQNTLNYSNVGLYNSMLQNSVATQQPQFYQVPVITNYPLNIANSQVAPQISPQIASQITPQIAPQISQMSTPIATPLSVQPVSNVYPIFNINNNKNSSHQNILTNNESSSSSIQEQVIDLTEEANNDIKSQDSNRKCNNSDINIDSSLDNEELDINASIENDNILTLWNKIKIAQKKQRYYSTLSQKYIEFINNANNRLMSLQEEVINPSNKESKKVKTDFKEEDNRNDNKKEKGKNKYDEILDNVNNTDKEIKSKESKTSFTPSKKSNSSSSLPKSKFEKNIIAAPSMKDQLKNLKKRSSIDLVNSNLKKVKLSETASPLINNSLPKYSLTNNNKPPPHKYPVPMSERSGINHIARNTNNTNDINNKNSNNNNSELSASSISSIKTTNNQNEIQEIKVNSCNEKTRLFSTSVSYIKKVSERKPRKFIHFRKSSYMVITSLGGEILFYNTKQKEEKSSLQAPLGGWPEDICSFSDTVFALSTVNKNKSQTQLAFVTLNKGLAKPKLHTFANNKPHDNGSIRITTLNNSDDCYKLFSAGADHKIFLWNIKEEERDAYGVQSLEFIHEKHTSAIQTICYNSWNDTVYTGGSDCKLYGFNIKTRRTSFYKHYDMRISNVLRNPVDVNQLLIMSSATKDQFRICDIRSKKTVLNFGIPTNENITQYAYPDYHKDGYLISFGSQNDKEKASVFIWDIRYISQNNSYVSDIKLEQGRIIKPLFHPYKSQIITIDTNGKAAFINYQMHHG